MLTPFALATVIGAIATGRVPVGNARGDLITSWLNPVSVLASVLAVASAGTWPRSTWPPTPAGWPNGLWPVISGSGPWPRASSRAPWLWPGCW